MDRVSKLMVFLIVAVTLPALLVAAPPAKTQECKIDGDIISNPDEVEIGISVGAWKLLDGQGGPASLFVKGSLLQESEDGAPTDHLYAPMVEEFCPSPCESTEDYFEYYGHARVLKKDGRFDFEFGLEESCVSPNYEDPLPYVPPLCPYRLIIFDGIYDRTADKVTFDSPARWYLMDYSLPDPAEYQVGSGQVSVDPGITVQFMTDGDGIEIEDETGPKKCHDGVDNDRDGDTDCEDDDCAKWCR